MRGGDSPQIYEDITKFSELKKLMEEQLEDYNMEPGFVTMNLVLFRDAIEHGTAVTAFCATMQSISCYLLFAFYKKGGIT